MVLRIAELPLIQAEFVTRAPSEARPALVQHCVARLPLFAVNVICAVGLREHAQVGVGIANLLRVAAVFVCYAVALPRKALARGQVA